MLKKVVDVDFTTFNPNSQQEHVGDLLALIHLHKHDRRDDESELWMTGLIPEKRTIAYRGEIFYVVRTYRHCCFGWPLVLLNGSLHFDQNIRCYTQIFIFDLGEVTVLPVELCSPIKCRAQGDKRGICQYKQQGIALSLLDYHVAHGYRNLSEPLLKQLIDDIGLVPPNIAEGEGIRPKDEYRMLLMIALDPKITEADAAARMLVDDELDGLEGCTELMDIDQELVKDAVDPKDMDKFTDEQGKLEKTGSRASRRDGGTLKLSTKLKSAFKVLKPSIDPDWHAPKPFKDKKPIKAAIIKAKKRVYDLADKDADKALKENLPAQALAWCDSRNGRWRITYKGSVTHQRSISWTELGMQVAYGVALDQAWQWAFETDAIPVPVAIEELLKEMGLWTGA